MPGQKSCIYENKRKCIQVCQVLVKMNIKHCDKNEFSIKEQTIFANILFQIYD